MLGLDITHAKQVLCLGAHSDDIEIGCGGTVLEMARQNPGLSVVWVVLSAEGPRAKEARLSAGAFLRKAAANRVVLKQFHMSYFPFEGAKIKEYFERLKKTCQPDVVFTHYREDRHQDHRVVSDLTWNTFRNHFILEYEIPKYDGDLGQPNVFIPLEPEVCQQKVESIERFFKTQSDKHWFTADTFLGLMRLRGMECASPTKYAEAFFGRKLVLGRAAS